MFKSSFSSPTIFVSWETLLLCNLCLLQNDFLWSNWNRPVNRLSGWGKSEENKGQEQTERRGGVYAPLAPLADLFLRFSPLQSTTRGILATTWYCFKTRQTAIHIKLSVALYYNSVNCDHPGECSAKKDCLRWRQCHLKQFFSGLRSPGRSQFTELWHDSWVQTIYSSFVLYTVKHLLSYPTHIFDFIYQNYRIVVTRFVDYYESLYLAKKKIM